MPKLKVNGLAKKLKEEFINKIANLNFIPKLVSVLVGQDTSSALYVKNISKIAKKLGFSFETIKFDSNLEQEKLLECIVELNNNKTVNGIIIPRPLPKHLDIETIFSTLSPQKDVESVCKINLGKIISQDFRSAPCTALGIFEILKYHKIPLWGKKVTILGMSTVVGKPLANFLLYQGGVSVTMCDINTPNTLKFIKEADILIVAIGSALYIKKQMIKKGVVIIDVGINEIYQNGALRIVGDVDYKDCIEKAGSITAVPKGVGKITTMMLFQNLLALQQKN